MTPPRQTPRLTTMKGRLAWTQIAVSFFIQWVGSLSSIRSIPRLMHAFLDPEYDKEALQEDLRALLVSLFRKRPRLNYFQV